MKSIAYPKCLLDLKQELKIRNISLPTKLNNEVIDKNKSSMTASKSNLTVETSVSKMNDINDSRNNNSLSLNASMDKTTSTFNNTSMMDTTIHNMSCGTTTTTESISPKSQNDSGINKSTQNSVLKCKLLKLLTCWKC